MAGGSFDDVASVTVASVTGDAKPAGVSLSRDEPDQMAVAEFRRRTAVVREHLRTAGVTEEDVLADLAACRRTRGRRTIG